MAEAPTIAAAGRAAGYAEASLSSLFRLCRRPMVRAIAHARRRQIAEGLAVKSEAVIALLWEVALTAKHPSDKIAACSELLKWLGPPGGVTVAESDDKPAETGAPLLRVLLPMANAVGVPMVLTGDEGAAEVKH